MEKIKVKIVNKSHHPLPAPETHEAAGMDVRAYLPDGPVTLHPMERKLIPPGLALKKGITVLNTPGTVDADYRGEICVILINLSNEDFVVNDGERVCQMLIKRCEKVEWESVSELDRTEREDGGFGHTGVS